ncbi:unnamed protein product [Closterium sp. NIES-65]|nr:unnamed protein product [Closterium sp. NIES-65]
MLVVMRGARPAGGKKGAVRSWGFTETELLSAQAGGEGDGELDGKERDGIVTRRLLIGAGLAVLALPVALYDIPLTVAPPTKPLFFYVVPLVRLQLALQAIVSQADSLDVVSLRSQLRFAVGTVDTVRENLVSTTVLLEDKSQQPAKELAFEIIDYLQQVCVQNLTLTSALPYCDANSLFPDTYQSFYSERPSLSNLHWLCPMLHACS